MPRQHARLPRRSSTYGIGKEIGGSVYVHRSYESLLGGPVAAAKRNIPTDFPYTIVKHHIKSGTVSFVSSPDFDVSDEPTAGDTWIVSSDGRTKFRKQLKDPYIYHHKWLMVAEDYSGFSVADSRARSLAWAVLPNLDRTRIGRQGYWTAVVLPKLRRLA